MERQPVKTIPIHEHLRPRLCDTYENDSIFDKFEVVFSGDAKNVMTGSYNNNFMIYPSDPDKEVEVVLQADKSAFKAKKVGVPTPINSSTSPTANGGKKGGSRAGSPAAAGQGQRMRKETDADQIDFNKKILHMSWHPFEDSIAIAATNNVSLVLNRSTHPSHVRLLTPIAALRLFCFVDGHALEATPGVGRRSVRSAWWPTLETVHSSVALSGNDALQWSWTALSVVAFSRRICSEKRSSMIVDGWEQKGCR